MTDIDDIDTDALAAAVVDELDAGQRIGDTILLSKRQLLAIAGAGLSAGALAQFGISEAEAQEAAGQVGISEAEAQEAAGQVGTDDHPVDIEAWDLNVANQLTSDLDAGGNSVTNLGGVETGELGSGNIQIDGNSLETTDEINFITD